MMPRLSAIAALPLVLAAAPSVKADEIPPCKAPSGVEVVSYLNAAPHAVKQAVDAKVGPMANPGDRFNATDVVVEDLPANRLIFVWHRGDIWLIATEHGGIAYSDPIFAYRLGTGSAELIATRSAIPNTVCATAKEMLSQAAALR